MNCLMGSGFQLGSNNLFRAIFHLWDQSLSSYAGNQLRGEVDKENELFNQEVRKQK